MFHSTYTNIKINKLHGRALRIVYNDYELSFEQLLEKDKSFSIHHQNIHRLLVEIYKVFNNLSEKLFSQFFTRRNHNLGLRSESELVVPRVNSVLKGQNSLRYLGAVPLEIRNSDSLNLFKMKLKSWKPHKCPCRLCKDYVNGVGFVNIAT